MKRIFFNINLFRNKNSPVTKKNPGSPGFLSFNSAICGQLIEFQSVNLRTSAMLYFFASENKNSNPPSGLFLTEISPLCSMTAFFTIESPSPVPPFSRERP